MYEHNISSTGFNLVFHLIVNLQERDLWGGLGVDGRTILEWTLNAGNWVDSAQDRNY